MAFANSGWRELYEHAMIFVEPAVGSDHNPLTLNTDVPLNKVGKPFRFESFWLSDDECSLVMSEAWNQGQEGPLMLSVCKKLRACKERLKEWSRKKFGDLRLKIAVKKDRMLEVQTMLEKGFDHQLVAEERSLERELEDLWQKDAMYWHQHSRIKWLQMGDKNSRFFHLSTIQRRQRNQIMRLKDKGGIWKSEPKDIAGIIKLHFQDLYERPPMRDFGDVISLIDPLISTECNARLVRDVTREEVKTAVFELGPLRAPGSDGFPRLFYQRYWDTVGEEVFQAVQSFFKDGVLLREVSQTNVTLIPKVPNPESMNQLRPISLCRFLYKIISKVLTNRLQPFIDGIISEEQSAFIPGRQIQDNITVAHEVFHFLKHKKVGPKSSVAVKLDLNKAYDRVCWDFMFKVLEKLGFDDRWIACMGEGVCLLS